MKRWAITAVAAWAASASSAVQVSWDAQGAASTMVTVDARSAEKLCARLNPGQRVVWAFVSQSVVDFNLQHGQGKNTTYVVQKTAVTEARDAFEPPRAKEYCWMWTNRTEAPAQVSVQLRRR